MKPINLIVALLGVSILLIQCKSESAPETEIDIKVLDTVPTKIYIPETIALINPQTGTKEDIANYIEILGQDNESPEYKLIDLNNDGITELIISYYTGGAHCCDAVEIYKLDNNDEFEAIVSIEDGFVDENGNVIVSLWNLLGYFHSCFSCEIDLPRRDFINLVKFSYNNGKLTVPTIDTTLNTYLTENLEKLSGFDIPASSDNMDNGERKAFAKNIIVYHFNNNSELEKTKQIFYRYYHHEPDRDEIWEDIEENILYLGKNYLNAI